LALRIRRMRWRPNQWARMCTHTSPSQKGCLNPSVGGDKKRLRGGVDCILIRRSSTLLAQFTFVVVVASVGRETPTHLHTRTDLVPSLHTRPQLSRVVTLVLLAFTTAINSSIDWPQMDAQLFSPTNGFWFVNLFAFSCF
jgi:hypothetical protein